jgi:ubiquinone/menaquinone biosynthesis C-methylase UbiE
LIYKILPNRIKIPLFGDRIKFGKTPSSNDDDWNQWVSSFYYTFYKETQKRGVSDLVNHAGYKILSKLNLTNKTVLEIGPGDLPHVNNWKGRPDSYYIADIREEFLKQSRKKLDDLSITNRSFLLEQPKIPLNNGSIDLIIGFYVLEHLNPLKDYLNEFLRILKPDGFLIGGIPTEGGLAWGLGRYFSSRKYILQHSKFDPDKIICWEHPNLAPDILILLLNSFKPVQINYWPFRIKLLDLNLIISFIARKSK